MPAAFSILRRATCPHCWTTFPTEEVLWISAHADLLGDPRLGPEQLQRFVPTRFTLEGNALDAKGFVCHALACPRCHLFLPRALVETEPVFVSILGMPACGKSFFLTAMTWELRQVLPQQFALSFADADPTSNRNLNDYEELLFLNPRSDELIPLADLIRKTELQGELYDTVMYGNQSVSYPRPFLFLLQPQEGHLGYGGNHRQGRVLCLYDNAGEHFQPGRDSTSSPVTQHLARSRLLMFLFDPTQDQRFRKKCLEGDNAAAGILGNRSSRQEAVLHEAAARVRRYTGLPHNVKHTRPLIVVVTKHDAWRHLLGDQDMAEPWIKSGSIVGLDLDKVERRSQEVRELMMRLCPEIVTAAESFAHQVGYVPVSALGSTPVPDAQTGNLAVRPRDIQPTWATVPLLYGLCRWLPGTIPGLKRKQGRGEPAAVRTKVNQLPDGY
jgi:hypothetical protein